MSEQIVVIFRDGHTVMNVSYQAGETAGFSKEHADSLVRSNKAVYRYKEIPFGERAGVNKSAPFANSDAGSESLVVPVKDEAASVAKSNHNAPSKNNKKHIR